MSFTRRNASWARRIASSNPAWPASLSWDGGIYLLAALMAAFRAATAFVLVLGVPNWRGYTALAYLPYYILLAALFLRAFRASPARLAYVFLLS